MDVPTMVEFHEENVAMASTKLVDVQWYRSYREALEEQAAWEASIPRLSSQESFRTPVSERPRERSATLSYAIPNSVSVERKDLVVEPPTRVVEAPNAAYRP